MVGITWAAGTSAKRFGNGLASLVGAAIVAGAVFWSAEPPIKELLARFTFTNHAAENALAIVEPDPERDASRQNHLTARRDVDNSSPTSEVGSSLSLRLLSTWPGRNAHEGTAQLGTGAGNVRTYVAGALLSDGTRLAEIRQDSVVLMREGQAWTLRAEELPRGPTESPLLTPDQPHASPDDSLSHELLTDYVRPSPVYDETAGVLLGYKVYPGVNEQAFKRTGLEPGDVILAINHVPLNEPAAIDLLRQLTRGIAVTARVQRNGQEQEIALNGAVPLNHSAIGRPDGASRAHRS